MTEQTPLEEIKSLELEARKLSLIEIIAELKSEAKEIKRIKFYTESILKELGYETKDIKSIIDYINSQVEIDEKDILKDVRKHLEKKKEKTIAKMISSPYSFTTTTNNPSTWSNLSLPNAQSSNTVNAVSGTYVQSSYTPTA